MKHLRLELYYLRFSNARTSFVRSHKTELAAYVSLLQCGDELEINSARSRLIASCFGGDDASVSIDIIDALERNFLLQQIWQESKKKKHSFSETIDALLAMFKKLLFGGTKKK